MKIKKKIIIPIAAVAVVAALVIAVPNIVSGSGSKDTQVSTNPLAKMDLENIVSVTGTVKSEDATNVYSTLAYQVQSVNVEVGDRVNAGDVLCVLDTESLNAKIEQQSTALANNQAKAQNSLAIAQNSLETEKFNQDKNYDTALLNAEKAVEQAKQTYESRKSALENAQLTLTSAVASQRSNRTALNNYTDMYGTPKSGDYDPDYDKLYQAYVQGDVSVSKAENAVVDAEKAIDDAKQGVYDAMDALKATQALKAQAIISGQYQVQSAQLNTNFSDSQMQLEELKKDLDNAIIKAPVSGTVTAVLATEGGNGQGLLFVIEDTQKLMVTTKIKEYDIAAVKLGQPAKVKSDGTGDNEYTGKVSKIAPTALKAVNGDTLETTDVQFAAEVGVVSTGDLKIGMNARIDIITEQKTGVYAVSYESVLEDENGGSTIYVARPQTIFGEGAEGTAGQTKDKTKNSEPAMVVAAIPVTTGMETDFYIEVISDQLKEGDLIISNPAGLTDGQKVVIGTEAAGMRAAGGPGGPGGGMAVRMG